MNNFWYSKSFAKYDISITFTWFSFWTLFLVGKVNTSFVHITKRKSKVNKQGVRVAGRSTRFPCLVLQWWLSETKMGKLALCSPNASRFTLQLRLHTILNHFSMCPRNCGLQKDSDFHVSSTDVTAGHCTGQCHYLDPNYPCTQFYVLNPGYFKDRKGQGIQVNCERILVINDSVNILTEKTIFPT